MSDALLGALTSGSLIGLGIFLLLREPAKLPQAAVSPKQLRQGGILGIVFGVVLAVFTVYLFLRGLR